MASSIAVILGMEYGTPAILRPIPGLRDLRDDTLRWFGWAEVPMETRLRLDRGIGRLTTHGDPLPLYASVDDPVVRQLSGFDFPNILDEHEAGYDRRA